MRTLRTPEPQCEWQDVHGPSHLRPHAHPQKLGFATVHDEDYPRHALHECLYASDGDDLAGELSVMFDASREGLWSKGEARPCVSFPIYFNDIQNALDLSFGDTMRVGAADAFRCGSLMMSPNLESLKAKKASIEATLVTASKSAGQSFVDNLLSEKHQLDPKFGVFPWIPIMAAQAVMAQFCKEH